MSRVPARVSRVVLARDNEQCVRCFVRGSNIHHRQMRSQADKLSVHWPSNLIVLCGSGTTGCHGYIHANPEEAYLKGWLVKSYDVPHMKPVLYFAGGYRQLLPDGTYYYAAGPDDCREPRDDQLEPL